MSHQQNCPLCGDNSTFFTTQNPPGKQFVCHTCNRFWIDEYSEEHLGRMPEEVGAEIRKKLSGQSQKSADGRIYVVRESNPSEIIGDGLKVARESLKTEWIEVSDLS